VQVIGNIFQGISAENIHSLGSNTDLRVIGNISDDASLTQTAGEIWRDNVWGTVFDRNYGSAAIVSGGTIAHGLRTTPTSYGVQPISATPTGIYVSAVSATTMTVTFTGGGTQTFKWWAEV
jgi:hypothetical protein